MAVVGVRWASRAAVVAICAAIGGTAAPAHAIVLDITSTEAGAADGIALGGTTNPLSASVSDTQHLADGTTLSGAAVADVFAGHLGASASSTGPTGGALAQAYFTITFAVSDAAPGDFLTAQMSLHGSFTPGSGATAQLLDFDTGDLVTLTCNGYNDTHYGVPCISGYQTGPPILDSTITVNVPLYGRDTLTLQGVLQLAAATVPYSLDFLNSADLTLTVPNGAVVNGNPGGSLIQGAVPEPDTAELLAAGLVGAGFVRRRGRRG